MTVSLPGPSAVDAAVQDALAQHAQRPGALLPILHALQHRLGCIPAAAVPAVADALNLSRAEVHGVISFYPDFRTEPAGRTHLKVCRAEACQSRGGNALADAAQALTGCAWGETTPDGACTLEAVYCLGLCAQSPAVMIDGAPHAGVTPDRLRVLLAQARADASGRATGVTAPDATSLDTLPAAEPRSDLSPSAPLPGRAHVVAEQAVAALAATRGVTLYVPGDAAAIAAGADAVAAAIAAQAAARGLAVHIVRNGSRGLLWLEPMVEVVTPVGRVAYGPVTADVVSELFEAGWLTGGAHALSHGLTDEIPYLARQQRLVFARVGKIDPRSAQAYVDAGGLAGLRRAVGLTPEAIVAEVTQSGLRGRGGAAFPAGVKWQTVLRAPGERKIIVCNADEGDSGTFSDRLLLEGDPFVLIEGMAIAGLAVGATQGYVYVRSEYPHAVAALDKAIDAARDQGWIGPDVLGSGRAFELEVRVGAGAYICGEETSLLESLEGKRGQVRAKPPLPALRGAFGLPTVVNNVITLASVPDILAQGPEAYRALGVGRSLGTLPFQLAGNLRHGGLVEVPFGVTLRELLYDYGGGSASGRPLRAVQVGGPLGAYLPESQWDTPLDYEAYAGMAAMVGHGGIVAFDDTVDLAHMARHAMAFCAVESCGKCTPCRIGSTRGVEVIDRIAAGGPGHGAQVQLLRDLCDTMVAGSLCALGGMTPYPVISALTHFPEDFGIGRREAA